MIHIVVMIIKHSELSEFTMSLHSFIQVSKETP